ncbi:MAG: RNA-guided pseudouridylation complex pseudouridine synthase subunit Cbf5 [Planctomycetota bacterium]|nr:MAG: RNA-guided pseudouridylation complex pseudouridine synthase subunit Cbf5 [Planctomycetota bacterium]
MGKFVRLEGEDKSYIGTLPRDRSIPELLRTSVVCLDKPHNRTTHQTTQGVKKILGVKKVGHGGQLEPVMSGLVVVLLEDACKITRFIIQGDREYVFRLQFSREVPRERLERAFAKFTGKIKQVPPLRSKTRRVLRTKFVESIEILDARPRWAKVKVICESGTYLRKLFYDMTRLLRANVSLSHIRRTRSGNLTIQQAVTFGELSKAYQAYKNEGNEEPLRSILIPMEETIFQKKIYLTDASIPKICSGRPVFIDNIVAFDDEIEAEEVVAMFSLNEELVAIGKTICSGETMKTLEDGVVAYPIRVVMPHHLFRQNNNHVET